MEMKNKDPSTQYLQWFNALDEWQKDLFNKLMVEELDQKELENCFRRYIDKLDGLNCNCPEINFVLLGNNQVRRLLSIKNIVNIGAINNIEGIPLYQDDRNLCLLFGNNGSGKSTLINLLKNACGARGSKKVIGDVFEDRGPSKASIIYMTDEEKQFDWTPCHTCQELSGLQFFDSDYYQFFSKSRAEILLEPKLFYVLRRMVEAYNSFKIYIDKEIAILKNVQVPELFQTSKINEVYLDSTNTDEIKKLKGEIEWTEEKESELNRVEYALSESNPQSKIYELISAINSLKELLESIDIWYKAYSDEERKKISELKQNCIDMSVAVKTAGEEFYDAKMDGVGGDVWKILWRSAKEYSEKHAYPKIPFPNVGTGSKCVLCQQTLSEESKELFESFKEYVTSDVEKKLSEAQKALRDAIPPAIENWDPIHLRLASNHVPNIIISQIRIFYIRLLKRYEEMKDLDTNNGDTTLFPSRYFEHLIIKSINEMEQEKNEYELALSARHDLDKEKTDLAATKWFANNKILFDNAVKIYQLTEFYTDTTSISKFKTSMSEILITQKFVEQFRKELNSIGAGKIRVELKTSTNRGTTSHEIILKKPNDSKAIFSDILSEGEKKAVSFAAFVSELVINFPKIPLIFDDPTSSFDSKFEEKIADRIISLSKERQVIVFTHRIPMATLLYTKKEGQRINCIRLSTNPVGNLNPNMVFFINRANKNVDMLIEQAKKLSNAPPEIIQLGIDGLIINVRKLLEQIIEEIIFDGIVMRYQREIQSLKLPRLKGVSHKDIDLIDGLMGKYSTDSHYQPGEVPPSNTSIEDIMQDLNEIKKWIKDCDAEKEKIQRELKPVVSAQ